MAFARLKNLLETFMLLKFNLDYHISDFAVKRFSVDEAIRSFYPITGIQSKIN